VTSDEQSQVETMKLGKIMIFVSDLEAAKRFYCDILGFPLKDETDNRLAFVHEGCDFIAFKCESDASVENYSQVARSVFVFEVASIDQTLQELRAKGVRFLHQEPAENDFSRYAAFVDPFGNVHEIYEPKEIDGDVLDC
jgi:catechol 2,3-dioxygenase-like lactoylglutathione lyase family enzyme